MKTGQIYSIITLLLLTFSESNANINNDTLFTSPIENTELVQQFIDSLESVDTDYIVHVKKIDNSTNQTFYSNYILWADIEVYKENKYGVKELDELIYHDNIISIEENNYSRKLEHITSLISFLNIHQNTFFRNDSIYAIPITQKTDCIIKVEMRNSDKTIKLEFPCDLDFNSKYFSKLSGSLLYTIYLLIDEDIETYIDIQDYYTRKYGNSEENKEDDLKYEIPIMKKKLVFQQELLKKVENNSNSDNLAVYLALPDWKHSDSLFVDSLCNSGVDNIIVNSKSIFWSNKKDTTRDPSSSTTNIIWRENNSEYLKMKIFNKFIKSPIYLIKNEVFKFLDANSKILSDSLLIDIRGVEYNDYLNWKKENNLYAIEEAKKKEAFLNFPTSEKGEIIVYGERLVDRNNIRVGSGYNIYFNSRETVFSTIMPNNNDSKYLFMEYSERLYYSLGLLIKEVEDFVYYDTGITIKDCKTNRLKGNPFHRYWLTEVEVLKKEIKNLEDYIDELENELKELESENNSK
jgi:hypothetical protein